jgi:hypothetical protein
MTLYAGACMRKVVMISSEHANKSAGIFYKKIDTDFLPAVFMR